VVTNCNDVPKLQNPILNPAQYQWNEVKKVQHYTINVGELISGDDNALV